MGTPSSCTFLLPGRTDAAARFYVHVSFGMVLLLFLTAYLRTHAQSYEKLETLTGHRMEVHFSAGAEAKAERIARQLDKVMGYYQQQFSFSPDVILLVLSPEHWTQYTLGEIYGMPHYASNRTLNIAANDNPFWKSFIPQPDKVSAEFFELVKEAYTDGKGGLTMEPFFDLLAIHELGHAYHIQDSLVKQRKWMGELFANMVLHTYIAEREPQHLKALTTFPKMVLSTTQMSTLKYTSLPDFETHYNELGQEYPQNYGWYQCGLHIAAANIYDDAGPAAVKDLRMTLRNQRSLLDDAGLNSLLVENVRSVAEIPLKWKFR